MDSVIEANVSRKALADAVLKDPEIIEKILRVGKSVISDGFPRRKVILCGRQIAIEACKKRNIHNCKREYCDFCIEDIDIVPIIGK